MECSPPGSSVHGILHVRILEWVTIPFSKGIFLTQGSNPGLLHYRWILYRLSHQGRSNASLQRKQVVHMEMPRPALPNPTSRTGMDRVETHSRWFTGPMLYQLATAPGSQKVKLYLEASKNWGMLFTFPLEISEDRKHTDEGFTGVGGWQGRRVSSVIRCHEREVWGPPYPCSQTAWKPVLRVPPAGAQT